MMEVEDLKKSYGDFEAVKGVSFKIEDGEIFSIVGPNGAGKTTTLKCVMGFLKCSGKVRFKERELDEITRVREFSFLPEEKRLYPEMKLKDVVKMVENLGDFDVDFLKRMIDDFSLSLKSKVLELSHGMRTLLYLSIVFSKKASVYILDEPTWGLDPVMRKKVFDLMNDLVLKGKSIIYTSHVLPEVEKMADVLAVMKDGRIRFLERLETIREDYRIAFSRTKPEKGYRYVKRVDAGYLVLAKEEELEDVFESVAPADVEDVFDVVVGGEEDGV